MQPVQPLDPAGCLVQIDALFRRLLLADLDLSGLAIGVMRLVVDDDDILECCQLAKNAAGRPGTCSRSSASSAILPMAEPSSGTWARIRSRKVRDMAGRVPQDSQRFAHYVNVKTGPRHPAVMEVNVNSAG